MTTPLPPVGTRWGDITPEQRRALPVGTVIASDHGWPTLRKVRRGAWKRAYGPSNAPLWTEAQFDHSRRILSYPEVTP